MILYLIPARGGSKRLPGKNLKQLAGIPLVAHAIRRARAAARLVGGDYRVVVSTDSEEIASVAREWGADVLIRPAALATDEATSEAVALHGALAVGANHVVLVQPTSPLCKPSEVCAVALCGGNAALTHDGHPTGGAYSIPVSQLAAGRTFWQPGTDRLTVSAESSVDVDTYDDLAVAKALLAARRPTDVEIAGRKIGTGHPCFVIAEAGINHGGAIARAIELVEAAANAGADAVKFQAFDPDALAEPGPHRDLLAKHRFGKSAYELLAGEAARVGLYFLVSVFDEGSADLVDDFVPAHKIPSGEIINLPLLRHVASKGKPVILSAGMATMVEIDRALEALEGVPVALLHCVSEYPAQMDERLNLGAIGTLRQAFNVPVGWSDHTTHGAVLGMAVARGACIVEKHLKLDGYEGPDSEVSIGPKDFSLAVGVVRMEEEIVGTGEKVPTVGELETAKVARRINGLRRNPCSPVA